MSPGGTGIGSPQGSVDKGSLRANDSAEGCEGSFVIGFLGDFGNQLLMKDSTLGINDHHRPCQKTSQWPITDGNTIGLAKLR